jgi:hypothetical protein
VFPSPRCSVANSQFTLRIDAGGVLPAHPPGLVAAAVGDSEWRAQGNAARSTSIVLGGAPISDGPPEEQASSRSPRAAGLGDESHGQSAHDAVFGGALANGTVTEPVRGLLFFHYVPKTKAAPHSLELIYDNGSGGKVTIRLL